MSKLSSNASRVLASLEDGSTKNRQEISVATGIHKSNLGQYMHELEANGFVVAQRGGGKTVLYTKTKPPELDLLFDVFFGRKAA